MDFGKHIFTKKKNNSSSKSGSRRTTTKEIKFRPSTDIGDYNIKLKKIKSFILSGDKTKISVRFRGREILNSGMGLELLDRLKDELKPKYFLMENVPMKQEYQDVISKYLGVEPIEINSSLVSAQNRRRLYWTNIPQSGLPEDKGIMLKDILEDGCVDRDKSFCLDANYWKGGNLKTYFEKHRRQLVFSKDGLCHVGEANLKGIDSLKRVYHREGKAPTLTTMGGGHREPKVYTQDMSWRKLTPLECERLQTLPSGYTEGVSNTQRYKICGNGFTVDVIAHILKGLI